MRIDYFLLMLGLAGCIKLIILLIKLRVLFKTKIISIPAVSSVKSLTHSKYIQIYNIFLLKNTN